jgi:hypothetical protein
VNFIDIVLGAPTWVWVILVYLLIVGIRAFYPTVVPLWKLGIMPTILLLWSFYSIYIKCTQCLPLFGLWLGALMVGIVLGYYMIVKTHVTFDASAGLFHMPGSIVSLMLSGIFFVIKYSMGVMYALTPDLKNNMVLTGLDIAISALIVGIVLGRFLMPLYEYYRSAKQKHI